MSTAHYSDPHLAPPHAAAECCRALGLGTTRGNWMARPTVTRPIQKSGHSRVDSMPGLEMSQAWSCLTHGGHKVDRDGMRWRRGDLPLSCRSASSNTADTVYCCRTDRCRLLTSEHGRLY